MKKKPEFKFKVGDRVTERPRINLNAATTAQGKQEYSKRRTQRYGTVVDYFTLKNKRGSQRKYVKVLWDGFATPSDHEQMRLCLITELADQTEYFLL